MSNYLLIYLLIDLLLDDLLMQQCSKGLQQREVQVNSHYSVILLLCAIGQVELMVVITYDDKCD